MTYCGLVSIRNWLYLGLYTHWNEDVGNSLLVLLPSLAVLASTSINVPLSTVNDHNHEEDEVKPREGTPKILVNHDPRYDVVCDLLEAGE